MPAIYHNYSQTVADGTATSVIRPSDWNSAHPQSYTILGNTTGNSTGSGTNIQFYASRNIAIEASNDTIIFRGFPALEGYNPIGSKNIVSSSPNISSVYFQQFKIPVNVEFSQILLPMSFNITSGAGSISAYHTIRYGLYSRTNGTASTQWSLISSSSIMFTMIRQSNVFYAYQVSAGTTSIGRTAINSTQSSSVIGIVSGPKFLYLPWTLSSLSNGVDYAFGYQYSSSTSGGTSPLSAFTFFVGTFTNNTTFGRINSTNIIPATGTVYAEMELARYNTTALPDTWAVSSATVVESRARQYFGLDA